MSPYRRYLIGLFTIVALFVGVFWLAEFATDWMWYRHDAYPVVIQRRVLTKLALFAVTAPAVFLLLWLNLRAAMRSQPRVQVVDDGTADAELRALLDSAVRPAVRWLPVLVALVGGLGVGAGWQMWLLAFGGQPFGQADPQFGLDIGFYVYRLGAWRQALSSLSSLLVLTLAAVAGVYAFVGQIRVRDSELTFGRRARTHLLILAAAILLVRAALMWLKRYDLVLRQRPLFPGAGWTDLHVLSPALAVSAALAVVAALVCLWVTRPGRGARPAYLAIALHLAAVVLGAGLAPGLVQRVHVVPNEVDREQPYIDRAIAATRRAYAIDRVDARQFPAVSGLTAADLARNAGTIDNVRLWDQQPALRTYKQLQEIRQYYDIVDVDTDRYHTPEGLQQVLIAARELNHNQLDVKARSWINQHLEYTHGYGVAVSSANRSVGEGQPQFLLSDIPPRGDSSLTVAQPRLYFSEVILLPPEMERQQNSLMPGQPASQRTVRPDEEAERIRRRMNSVREPDESDYLLVNARRDEFDFAETRGNQEIKHRTRYDGAAGVPLRSRLARMAFALRLHSLELLVSGLLTPDTKVLMHRQVTRRCQKVAPFLQWDTNPYPVVANGRVYWICEGYTFTQSYPYSEMHYERERTPRGWRYTPTWNYLRNPVKAVVDAYDGTVALYVVDDQDPLIASWDRLFPGVLQPASAMPDGLREHLRYPLLLFRSQADAYRRYHMTDANTFYAQEDLWSLAREVDREAEQAAQARGRKPEPAELYREMTPYYLTMSLPGEPEVGFMLIAPFTPAATPGRERGRNQRDNLIAWMVARCDPDRYGELVVFQFPKDTNVYGPLQVEARIDQDDAISQQITLWSSAGSRVIRGNLQVIPIESSLLYVQPLYLESDKKGLPELKRVVVAYGDQVVMEPTLGQALARLFGGGAGRTPPAQPQAPTAPATPRPPVAARPAPASGQAADARLVAEAQSAFDAADAALRRGDWAAYQREQQRLRRALEALAGR